MKSTELLDLYSDYLLSSLSYTRATRLSRLVNGVLIFDDSIEEKLYTDENAIVGWHFDHRKERNVKGINFLSALYYTGDVSLTVAV